MHVEFIYNLALIPNAPPPPPQLKCSSAYLKVASQRVIQRIFQESRTKPAPLPENPARGLAGGRMPAPDWLTRRRLVSHWWRNREGGGEFLEKSLEFPRYSRLKLVPPPPPHLQTWDILEEADGSWHHAVDVQCTLLYNMSLVRFL